MVEEILFTLCQLRKSCEVLFTPLVLSFTSVTVLRTAIDIYFYVQSVTTPPGKVTIARMRVEIQPTKIGLEAVSSEELKIQNLLQDFPASQSVNFGDRYGFDCCLANY